MHIGRARVVIDTNIAVSAFLSPDGNEARVFELFLNEEIVNYTSEEIINELEEVIYRRKFAKSILYNDKEFMLKNFRELSMIIKQEFDEKVIKNDIKDDKIINCALTAKADIISGDFHLLSLRNYKGIRIISAKEFYQNENERHFK